jgi:S1-C subfamily serine protease
MKFLSVILCVAFLASSAYAAETAAATPTNSTAADLVDQKLQKVLYPVVRVLNGSGGGSGTVVYSEDREGKGEFQNFVLTNHHVVDNLIHVEKVWDNLTRSYKFVEKNDLAEVELFAYANGGATVTKTAVKADVVAYVATEDIALLKLRHTFKIEFTARILPPGKNLRLFQEIYAVGCPLLVDPMFTQGEVTDIENLIDNVAYTGGTANIIWGNSGGAVMSQFGDEWYFCGIPSRGYGAQNGQFVTYLGYYIPPSRIQLFITSQKLDFLVDPSKTPTQSMEEREKIQSEKQKVEEDTYPTPKSQIEGDREAKV